MTYGQKDIPVRKVRIRHPQSGEMGWTFRVAAIGTENIEHICRNIGRRLLVDPKIAAVIFSQIADEIVETVQDGIAVDMGVLGFVRPAITGQGWAADEKDMTLHGTSGRMVWLPGKKTKRAFHGVGCTLDWMQRHRDRQRYKKHGDLDGSDDEEWDDTDYPLDIMDE